MFPSLDSGFAGKVQSQAFLNKAERDRERNFPGYAELRCGWKKVRLFFYDLMGNEGKWNWERGFPPRGVLVLF